MLSAACCACGARCRARCRGRRDPSRPSRAAPGSGRFLAPGVVIIRPRAQIRSATTLSRTHARTHGHTHSRTRMHAQTRTHAHTRMHAGTAHARTHARTHVRTHARTHNYACSHARTHRHAQTRTHARTDTHAQTRMHVPGSRYAAHCAIMPPIDAPITAARPAQHSTAARCTPGSPGAGLETALSSE